MHNGTFHQAVGQRGKPCVAERGYGMEEREKYPVTQRHPISIAQAPENSQSSDQFNAQRDPDHTPQQHKDLRHPFGIRISAYGQLAFVSAAALKKIGEQYI